MPKPSPAKMLKFLSKLSYDILLIIFAAVVGTTTLVSLATGTIDILYQAINTPTPLWATIALVLLLALYMYEKMKKNPYKNSNDIFNNYYFNPSSGAWIDKNDGLKRICASCKIKGIFSPLSLLENQKKFQCPNCGKTTPNIPKICITQIQSHNIRVVVPKSLSNQTNTPK